MSGDDARHRNAEGDAMPKFDKLYVQTPLIESRSMSDKSGKTIYLKLENTQPTASFKLRGISNLIQEVILTMYEIIIRVYLLVLFIPSGT